MKLESKVALVTGAGRGIGRAIALRFALEGAAVVVNDKDADVATATVVEIAQLEHQAIAAIADVSVSSHVTEMVHKALERYGHIDILVNNAGYMSRGFILDVTEEEWDQQINVNLKGTFLVSQLVARDMVTRKSGAIINISSTLGILAKENRAAYCASKGAVNLLTKAMALDLAPYGVRVNTIAPGIVETRMHESWLFNAELRAERIMYQPMARFGLPEDIANAAVFLASDEASYTTGAILTVDGAVSAHLALGPSPSDLDASRH